MPETFCRPQGCCHNETRRSSACLAGQTPFPGGTRSSPPDSEPLRPLAPDPPPPAHGTRTCRPGRQGQSPALADQTRAGVADLARRTRHRAAGSQADAPRTMAGQRPSEPQGRQVFVLWTNERGLTSSLEVPTRSPEDPATFIEDDDRVEQLRRCVNDATLPLDVRVIGSLVLLMGLRVTRILELTIEDVVVQDSAVQLKLDGGSLKLPARLAHLVRQQLHQAEDAWEANRAASTIPWLPRAGRPCRPQHCPPCAGSRRSCLNPRRSHRDQHRQRNGLDELRQTRLDRLHQQPAK